MWHSEKSQETETRKATSNPLRLIAKVGDQLVFLSQNGMFEITAIPGAEEEIGRSLKQFK